MNKKLIGLSVLLLLLTVLIGISVGSTQIPFKDVINILSHKMLHTTLGEGIEQKTVSIVWILRFPRVLLALLVGASLAVSGSSIQSVLKNPLASPYTLGVSAGASLGVVLVIISGVTIPYLGYLTLTTVGFISGLVTVFIVLKFAKKVDHGFTNQTIILSGMVLALFVNAVLTMVTALSHNDLQRIVLWQMGSFSLKSWKYVYAILPFFIVGFLGTLRYSKELDALCFGEEQASTLGVEVPKVKKKLIIYAAVLTGSAVATSGTIGFVGLVAPHICRKVFGPKHTILIPMSVVFGGIFMIVMDLIARTIIPPSELPVGAITALIGAPFFSMIFFSRRKR
jgi:iron complex transport system permease protein